MERIILKISGEALSGNDSKGINAEKVQEIASEIKALYETGISLGIIVGAGNIWRGRDAEKNHMEQAKADYMGMLGTILNSLALENALNNIDVPTKVMSMLAVPTVADTYTRRDALELLEKRTVVIFAGGTGNPYFTTDTAAALKATEVNAKLILMAKNGVDGVYSSDPKTNKDAVRFNEMTYDEILANNLKVMDLTAATLCNQNKISMVIFDMNVKGNIKRAYENPEIGTIIKSK
jgi:uridylate kinase